LPGRVRRQRDRLLLRHRRDARPRVTAEKRNAPNAIRSLRKHRPRALVPKDFQHPGDASSASDSASGARRTVGGRPGTAQASRNAKTRSQREKLRESREAARSASPSRKRNTPNVRRFVHSACVLLPRKASVPLRSFNLLRLALGARRKLRHRHDATQATRTTKKRSQREKLPSG
jgi:hypothetical protein